MGKDKPQKPPAAPEPHRCQIHQCPNTDLIQQKYDAVFLLLCRDHMNRLIAYLGHTQQHEDFLIAHSAFQKAMSPWPSTSGMGNDADAISENIRLENIVRGFINEWLANPDATELKFRNEGI